MVFLSGKNVLIFDWDGTLLDSMPTKLRTFSETLSQLVALEVDALGGELSDRISSVYRRLSGIPRRRIFDAALADLKVNPDAIPFDGFDRALRERNQSELLTAPLFLDAEAFLRRLLHTTHRLYISSSVPQGELEFLVARLLPGPIARRLSGVFGSDGVFSKGVNHFARILQETGAEPQELLFFGDDRADAELSEQAGISCVLIDRNERFSALPGVVGRVRDFSSLNAELPDA